MKLTSMVVAAACAIATAAQARVRTKEIDYRQGATSLEGFLAWDDAAKGKRPGVLLVHEWWGLNQHMRDQATRLAEAGYVAFAVDMYGKGKVTTHPKDAMAFAAEASKDPAAMAARFDAGLAVLKKQPEVDPDEIAAFGYCFGGGVVLRMARAGADLDAVVTFHGAVEPALGMKGRVKPAVLVQTGGADPVVPLEQVRELEKEMKAAGADVRVIVYPNAKHGFTNPDADKAGSPGLVYDWNADRESWQAAMDLLKRVFGT